MARESLVSVVANALLDRMVSGELPAGTMLPSELVIGEEFEVSRLTAREAVKQLAAVNVIRTERGRGSIVNDVSRWTSIEAVARAATAAGGASAVSLQVLQMRRMLEVGAAELAAPRVSEEDVAALRAHLAQMRTAHSIGDVARFVEGDLAFHDVLLRASGNLLVPVMFEPVRRLLAATRLETSEVPEIQAHAIEHHEAVLRAAEARDGDACRTAMDAHMAQTMDDLRAYVLTD
ncbi:FCD domain-containing protein [Nocardioides sp. GY 10127]|uniref:FadR/GntR family transcriptional regulator n=1 Tax=Nocardioides sp. GY 10127 TaxID=2569762 RepID=UPI0010A75137|nr:FCD domain-containing protein [Nocardioides sp. GY 10127]TIC79984.1 FadR family transcriptional regulator [Nocardioides sp. GY 10127]